MKGLLKDLQCARTQAVTVTEVMSIVQHTLTCRTSGTQQSLVIHKSGAQSHKIAHTTNPACDNIGKQCSTWKQRRKRSTWSGDNQTQSQVRSNAIDGSAKPEPSRTCAKLRQCCLRCRNRLDSAAGCAQEKKRCRNVCRRARESRMKLLLSTRILTRKP